MKPLSIMTDNKRYIYKFVSAKYIDMLLGIICLKEDPVFINALYVSEVQFIIRKIGTKHFLLTHHLSSYL